MDYIFIGGKNRPCKLSIFALQKFCELRKCKISEAADFLNAEISAGNIITVADMLYCGLWGGARREKVEMNFTRDDVYDWVDDEGYSIFQKLSDIFASGMGMKETIELEKKKAAVPQKK